MILSNLYDYSDGYILVNGTIEIEGPGADDVAKRFDERNKGVVFKNCAPYIKYISEINNTQINHAKDIDFVMPMYNLIEYSVTIQKHQEVYGNIIEIIRIII